MNGFKFYFSSSCLWTPTWCFMLNFWRSTSWFISRINFPFLHFGLFSTLSVLFVRENFWVVYLKFSWSSERFMALRSRYTAVRLFRLALYMPVFVIFGNISVHNIISGTCDCTGFISCVVAHKVKYHLYWANNLCTLHTIPEKNCVTSISSNK